MKKKPTSLEKFIILMKQAFSKDNFAQLSTWSGLSISSFVLIDIFLLAQPKTGIQSLDRLFDISAWAIGCYLIYWGVPEIVFKREERLDREKREKRSNDIDKNT